MENKISNVTMVNQWSQLQPVIENEKCQLVELAEKSNGMKILQEMYTCKEEYEDYSRISNSSYNQCFLSDCMDVMARYPDNYFDLALCDIPYGINVGNMAYLKETKTTVKQKNGTRLNGNAQKKVYTQKDWDLEPPKQEYFDELKRISKHQIIFGVEYVNWTGLGNGRIKWKKGVAEGMSFKKYELAYCSMIDSEIELPLLWAGMMQAKSLSEPMTQQGNKKLNEKRIHPCHKPIMLYDKLLLDYGFRGMKIIDTHLGSGSSRIAADKFGASVFVGCEIDSEYFEAQENRFNNYKASLASCNRFPLDWQS